MDVLSECSYERSEAVTTSMLLPNTWKTERMRVIDSTLDQAQELQQINDLLPSIRGWTDAEVDGQAVDRVQLAIVDGVLPPSGSKDLFRLQSIRLRRADQLIGFWGGYYGFPDAETLWMNVIAFHPSFQRQGYGSELMAELSRLVAQLGPLTRMRGYIWYGNLPSLRFFVQAGFDRVVTIAEDPNDAGEFHFLLENTL